MSPFRDVHQPPRAPHRPVLILPTFFDGTYTLSRRESIGRFHSVECKVDFPRALLETARFVLAAEGHQQGSARVEFDGADIVVRLRGVR